MTMDLHQIRSVVDSITLLNKVVSFMEQSGYRISRGVGECNLIYLEGINTTLTLNDNPADGWNDLRCLFKFDKDGNPYWVHMAQATCEPGLSATNSEQAKRNGGVARLQLTQYPSACKMGFHKSDRNHPALVQCSEILVFRDNQKTGRRYGPLKKAYGVNHHGTRSGFKGLRVGNWSMGCCVAWNWEQHMSFIKIMSQDSRYLLNKNYAWDFCLISAKDLLADLPV